MESTHHIHQSLKAMNHDYESRDVEEITDEEILGLIGTEPPEGALFVTFDDDGELILTTEEPD